MTPLALLLLLAVAQWSTAARLVFWPRCIAAGSNSASLSIAPFGASADVTAAWIADARGSAQKPLSPVLPSASDSVQFTLPSLIAGTYDVIANIAGSNHTATLDVFDPSQISYTAAAAPLTLRSTGGSEIELLLAGDVSLPSECTSSAVRAELRRNRAVPTGFPETGELVELSLSPNINPQHASAVRIAAELYASNATSISGAGDGMRLLAVVPYEFSALAATASSVHIHISFDSVAFVDTGITANVIASTPLVVAFMFTGAPADSSWSACCCPASHVTAGAMHTILRDCPWPRISVAVLSL